MNKKMFITALLALVWMAGQVQGQVHYRLEGFISDSTITGKAYLMDMFVHSGEIVDTVNISKGFIEPVEGELTDTTICQLLVGDLPVDGVISSSTFFMYPIFLGGGTTKIDGRHGRYSRLSGTTLCDDAFSCR